MDHEASVNGRSDGRDGRGKFAVGNRAALGNANNRKMQALRAALLDVVTPEAIREVGEKYLAMAKGGDLEAGKVLLAYLLPKPPASLAIELSAEPRPLVDPALQAAMLADEEAMDLACRLDERLAWVGRNGHADRD